MIGAAAASLGRRATRAALAAWLLAACAPAVAPQAAEKATPSSSRPAPTRPEPSETSGPVGASPGPADAAVASPSPDLPGGFRDLEVPGFRPAWAYVPPGATAARFPLAVVTHGAGGMSEPHCERWRQLLAERAYILCPRGTAIGLVPAGQAPTGYFYRDHRALGREVMAARAAAMATFGERLDASRALYVGFSQGATMGALFLHELAETSDRGAFARLVLVDGGWLEWTRDLAQKERERGLDRVLLVCGQARCAEESRRRVRWIEQAGLPIRFEWAQGAGHTWGGKVAERIDGAIDWLLEGDPRFQRRVAAASH